MSCPLTPPSFKQLVRDSTSTVRKRRSSDSHSTQLGTNANQPVNNVDSGEILQDYSTPAEQLECEPRRRPQDIRVLGPPPFDGSSSEVPPETLSEPHCRARRFAHRAHSNMLLHCRSLLRIPLPLPLNTTSIVLETATTTQNNFVRLAPNTRTGDILSEKIPFLAGLRLLLEYTQTKQPPIIGMNTYLDMKKQGRYINPLTAEDDLPEVTKDAREKFILSPGWTYFLSEFSTQLRILRGTQRIDHDHTWTLYKLTSVSEKLSLDLDTLIYELEYFKDNGYDMGVVFMKERNYWIALEERAVKDLEILKWVGFEGCNDDVERKEVKAYLRHRIKRVRDKARKQIGKAGSGRVDD